MHRKLRVGHVGQLAATNDWTALVSQRLETPPGFEPGYGDLQSPASPLGHGVTSWESHGSRSHQGTSCATPVTHAVSDAQNTAARAEVRPEADLNRRRRGLGGPRSVHLSYRAKGRMVFYYILVTNNPKFAKTITSIRQSSMVQAAETKSANAEGVGFEPTREPHGPWRFSRPPPSTTRAPFREEQDDSMLRTGVRTRSHQLCLASVRISVAQELEKHEAG